MTESDRLVVDSQVARRWAAGGGTEQTFPPGATLHGLFREQALRHPDRPALMWTGGSLTYGRLDELSDGVARGLVAAGVSPGATVGVLGEPTPELVVALAGVAKAGGAAIYLDPRLPTARVRWMLGAAGADVVLTAADERTRLDDEFTTLGLEPWAGAGDVRLPDVRSDTVAMIYFTSGSTGTPKPVATTHRNLVSRLVGQDYSFGPEDVVLRHSPLSWDGGTFELWGPLVAGARCVLSTRNDFDLDDLRAHVTGFGVTSLFLTTSLLNLVVDESPDLLAPLRVLLTGGEVASVRRIAEVRRRYPALRLVHAYGPVETTIFATTHEITESAADLGRELPIGRPIANTQVYLLDGDRRPVPVGVVGEIWIGGDGVAVGYVGDGEATRARFAHVPLGAELVRLYRSGDLGRFRPDGVLEFHGRVDGQVKIRGHRIETGEITAALESEDGVRQAVVDVTGEGDNRRLVAYVVADAGVDLAGVRSALRDSLPAHLVPAELVALDEIPLTDTGKVARDRLPRPAAPSAPAESELESVVSRIWSTVLDASGFGVTDSFFALGGNSLTAARIVQRLRREVSSEVTLKLVFANPTVRRLATALRDLPPVTENAAG